MSRNDFEHPYVVGLATSKPSPFLKKKMNAALKKARLPLVCLDLVTPQRYLKNLLTCMRLMDVIGIMVGREYEKKAASLIPRLDKSARSAGRANVVVKNGKTFIGYYAKDPFSGLISLMRAAPLTPKK